MERSKLKTLCDLCPARVQCVQGEEKCIVKWPSFEWEVWHSMNEDFPVGKPICVIRKVQGDVCKWLILDATVIERLDEGAVCVFPSGSGYSLDSFRQDQLYGKKFRAIGWFNIADIKLAASPRGK